MSHPTAPRKDQGTDVITLGCRLNAYESEVIRRHAADAGMADAVVVNTCAVTREAERQARQTIRRLRRERPGVHIVVTGCAAQITPQMFADMPEVDRVIGNQEKLNAASFRTPSATDTAPRVEVADIMIARETAHHLIQGFEGRARAFVQVQQGCDHRCTFCIIPFGRGPNRSVPLDAIVEQIHQLVANGYGEVVLSGVDLTSYGDDLAEPFALGRLVAAILDAVPDLPRLRLSSLDPAAMDDDLYAMFAEHERLMPHAHLSLQAGDDMVLKRMKRRHTRDQALKVCQRLRAVRPDIVLGADLIAGFPTETDAMFENTRAFIAEGGLSYLHVFPYSTRPGTPAARMPQVPGDVRKARAARLRETGEAALARYLNGRVGDIAEVLVEDVGRGHDRYFAPVRLPFGGTPGDRVSVRISAAEGDTLVGEQV